MTPQSITLTKNNQLLELSLNPFSFEGIARLFGKDQYMFIDQLAIFQNEEDKIGDYEYSEEFFYGIDITIEMFLNFLKSIGEYEIFNMVFEIEDGTCFHIEEGMMKIAFDSTKEEKVKKIAMLLESSNNKSVNYYKVLQDQGQFVYFKQIQNIQIASNNELWNKYGAWVN